MNRAKVFINNIADFFQQTNGNLFLEDKEDFRYTRVGTVPNK